jgi:hypothetical protein
MIKFYFVIAVFLNLYIFVFSQNNSKPMASIELEIDNFLRHFEDISGFEGIFTLK